MEEGSIAGLEQRDWTPEVAGYSEPEQDTSFFFFLDKWESENMSGSMKNEQLTGGISLLGRRGITGVFPLQWKQMPALSPKTQT